MSLDQKTTARIAHLARLGVPEAELDQVARELSSILNFVEQLNEVDVTGIVPMSSSIDQPLRWRVDEVTDGAKAEDILANAPRRAADFFAVPKVVE